MTRPGTGHRIVTSAPTSSDEAPTAPCANASGIGPPLGGHVPDRGIAAGPHRRAGGVAPVASEPGPAAGRALPDGSGSDVRIARFSLGDQVAYGVVEGSHGEEVLTVITAHPFAPIELTEVRVPLADVRLLAPVLPSKIVAIGKNYADHVQEMGGQAPEAPLMFLKPSTSVIGPDDPIVLPRQSAEVHHEAELAVVIGRLCKDVPLERVHEGGLGYTCANDVTARDVQRGDGQWSLAKGFDTFCPLGPWLSTEVDPGDLAIQCAVDGEVRQLGRTSQMIHGVAELVAYVSQHMTLLPGDVILTGTPAGVGPIHAGESVTVGIDDVGRLTNPVVAEA